MDHFKELTLVDTARHGNLLATMDDRTSWPPIKEGQKVIFKKAWCNKFGIWIEVREPSTGKRYDLSPLCFDLREVFDLMETIEPSGPDDWS